MMPYIKLVWEHPDTSPDHFSRLPLQYLIPGPSKMAPTAAFVQFRDRTLLPMLAMHPDNPELPRFLECIEAVLAWRATVPLEERFWRLD